MHFCCVAFSFKTLAMKLNQLCGCSGNCLIVAEQMYFMVFPCLFFKVLASMPVALMDYAYIAVDGGAGRYALQGL